MKMHGEHAGMTTHTAAADTKSCDCCKGDSCPMKMHGDHADKAKDNTTGDAKSCDCACCKKDKQDVAKV